MLHRAWEHDGGAADFIQFKVEAVRHEGITCCPLLPLYQIDTETKEEGRAAAKRTAPFRSQRNCYRKRICYFGIADRRYRSLARQSLMRKQESAWTDLVCAACGAAVWIAKIRAHTKHRWGRRAWAENIREKRSFWHRKWRRRRGRWRSFAGRMILLCDRLCGFAEVWLRTDYGDERERGSYRRPRIFVKHGTDMDRYVEYMQHQTVLVRIE